MESHDLFKDFAKQKEVIEKLAPKFNELTLDVQEIFKHSDNPLFIAVLLFKLAEERNQTNKIMHEVNDKYDKIMLELKTSTAGHGMEEKNENVLEVLSEADEKILSIIERSGPSDAKKIQEELGYKGKNAASQRLNKLFKEGHLKKIQAGKKVLYTLTPIRT